jgi:CheY-like chemotaxis protein
MKTPLVLCVDDDHSIRNLYQSGLPRLGHEVIAVSNGNSALEVFEAKGRHISAAILDYHMPGMNGFELAVRLKSSAPQLPILMVSGLLPDLEDMIPFVDAAIDKGTTLRRIADCLQELLAGRRETETAVSV